MTEKNCKCCKSKTCKSKSKSKSRRRRKNQPQPVYNELQSQNLLRGQMAAMQNDVRNQQEYLNLRNRGEYNIKSNTMNSTDSNIQRIQNKSVKSEKGTYAPKNVRDMSDYDFEVSPIRNSSASIRSFYKNAYPPRNTNESFSTEGSPARPGLFHVRDKSDINESNINESNTATDGMSTIAGGPALNNSNDELESLPSAANNNEGGTEARERKKPGPRHKNPLSKAAIESESKVIADTQARLFEDLRIKNQLTEEPLD